METKLPQEPPKLEKLGKLDAIVLQSGKNGMMEIRGDQSLMGARSAQTFGSRPALLSSRNVESITVV